VRRTAGAIGLGRGRLVELATDPNFSQSHKLEIDTGKWLLSKLCPRYPSI
jgi:hypothetical protein